MIAFAASSSTSATIIVADCCDGAFIWEKDKPAFKPFAPAKAGQTSRLGRLACQCPRGGHSCPLRLRVLLVRGALAIDPGIIVIEATRSVIDLRATLLFGLISFTSELLKAGYSFLWGCF